MTKKTHNVANLGFENRLWEMAELSSALQQHGLNALFTKLNAFAETGRCANSNARLPAYITNVSLCCEEALLFTIQDTTPFLPTPFLLI
jgi:hypothetical protein